MDRYKTIIVPGLKSHRFVNHKTASAAAVRCINRFTAIGMPVSIRIA